MTTAIHEILLIGFGAFERATLESFFRMTEQRARRAASAAVDGQRRQRGYAAARPDTPPDLVLIDGNDPAVSAHAAQWREHCVIVGGNDPVAGTLGHVPRPINMMRLLELLDELMARRSPAGEASAAAPREPAPQTTTPPSAPTPAPAPSASPTTPGSRPAADGEGAAGSPAEAAAQILVVDDSDIALRFMARCLARFGLGVQLAHSGEEALQRVATGRFEFVFMDVSMPGIDGYQTCKLIKKRPYPPGRRAPRVVMLTSRGGMVDKMRGTLAGCDAYLTKPLQQDDLLRVIGDVFPAAQASAAAPASRPSSMGSV